MLFVCTVCMQSRWVYDWSWRSVLPVSWLVISVEGCFHRPLKTMVTNSSSWVRESLSQRAMVLCTREANTECLLAGL